LLARLDRKGLVRRRRGRIRLLARAGLEAQSCECYRSGRDAEALAFGRM
jgi:hypothetical protein